MSDPWRVTLLGGLRAQQGERIITRFKTQKVAALFAYLAFHRHQTHPREVLIELLWPESGAPTLRNSLSVALSSLRHQFEPPGVPQGTVLRADRFSVSLNPAMVTTDVSEFEEALQAGARLDSSLARAQKLTAAVELYQGTLLPGFYEDWVISEQERLSGLFQDALGAVVRDLEQSGDLRAALSHARRAVALDPLREHHQQQLMRLLAADGQSGSALRQYHDFVRLLEEEVGGEPSPVLRDLFRRIEAETGRPAPAAASAAPRPIAQRLTGPATVTLLLTDIVGSGRLLQVSPEAYAAARERYRTLLQRELSRHAGELVKQTSEGFVTAFASAGSAVACAVATQEAFTQEAWPPPIDELPVRMALHTGDLDPSSGVGSSHSATLDHATRMLSAAHGGQILVSDVTAALLPRQDPGREAAGVALTPLGPYRLRDTSEARDLFQLDYPGMANQDFGPLAAAKGHRANVPPRFNRFFGREQELAALRELLLAPETRLVTVTAAAGHGKTRFAMEAAERLTERFADAVYFVPLAEVSDPALVPGAVLDSLRVPRSSQLPPLDQLAGALSRRPTLVVLDNLEQLVDGVSGIVQALLARAPDLKLLVTSRRILGLTAEREFQLSPLPTPLGAESPEQLSLYDSVLLFIDRAQQVMPHFQMTNTNAAAVAALVSGLEGIPLAIELAAARVQVLTPGQMLAQLSQRLDFLATRKRDVAGRQASLRAALDWSYRLLTPELQRFLARLSVFRGGWSVQGAEAVCEEPLALDYLEQLRECSLVDHAESPTGDHRFRMLEALREYGQERLSEHGEVEVLKRRHLDYFLNLAELADQQSDASRLGDWLLGLEAELDNLRAVLTWAAATPQGGFDPRPSGVRLAGLLGLFWQRRGHLTEGRQRLSQLLATQAGTPADRAQALSSAGTLALRQLDYAAAGVLLEEALVIRRELGDTPTIASSLVRLGRLARLQGDYERARSLLEEGLVLTRALGNPRAIAGALNSLAELADATNDLVAAESFNRETLKIGRALHDQMVVAASLLNLGVHAFRSGDYAAARLYYEESMPLRVALGDRIGVANALHNLGGAACAAGEYATARTQLSESLTLRRELGDRFGVVHSLESFAALAVGASADEPSSRRAARLLGAARAMRQSYGSPLPPYWQARNEGFASQARERLGDTAFAAEFDAGQAMTWDEVVAFALEERPI